MGFEVNIVLFHCWFAAFMVLLVGMEVIIERYHLAASHILLCALRPREITCFKSDIAVRFCDMQ